MQNEFPIDLVVTYVDDSDPIWKKEKSKFFDISSKGRFRSWDNLKYWFRGVEKNMPFIRTVHLVVSNIEQVPDWLDQSKVHVVLHKEIIPEYLLPTFNSTTIEMFICMIPGLAENFIYSNDDMIPINQLHLSDFFQDGKPVYQLIRHTKAKKTFRMQCRNSYFLARKAAGLEPSTGEYIYTKHSMAAILKSACMELHGKVGDEIIKRCTKFREPWNCTQYLFPDYILLTNRAVLGEYSFKYFKTNTPSIVADEIDNGSTKIICINDSSVKNLKEAKKTINNALERKLPMKSRFEK